MDTQGLREALDTAAAMERISIIAALEPVVDREAWAAVAEAAYVDAEAQLKEVAAEFFRRCASLYAERLSPSFHMVPWDTAQLLEDEGFSAIYARANALTSGFRDVTADKIGNVLRQEPPALIVFRMMAAFSRDHVSYLLRRVYDVRLSRDDLRVIEHQGAAASPPLVARWRAACGTLGQLLYDAVRGELLAFRDGVETDKFRALTDKIDTRGGWETVANAAASGVPYDALLYQRYIGSAFGLAINASTSLKADLLEGPVDQLLRDSGIPFYRVGAREKVPGWEQAPDFFVPSKEAPVVLIEAKVAEDGGTARDKASRIERLSRLAYGRGATLISVVDGLGFLRINDVLAPILGNSKGLVFTYSDLAEMLEVPTLRAYSATTHP